MPASDVSGSSREPAQHEPEPLITGWLSYDYGATLAAAAAAVGIGEGQTDDPGKPGDTPALGADAQRAAQFVEHRPVKAVLLMFLLPWTMFALAMCPFALFFRQLGALAAVTLVAFGVLAAHFVRLGKKLIALGAHVQGMYWHTLGVWCAITLLIAAIVGIANYENFTKLYYIYRDSQWFQNALATEHPGAMLDAGRITFSSSAYVDPAMAVGYAHRRRLCVAPVLSRLAFDMAGDAGVPEAGFWVSGQDCCGIRGHFHCGGTATQDNGTTLTGVVLMEGWSPDLAEYKFAVEEAAASYGLRVPNDAIILGIGNIDDTLQDIWDDAVWFYAQSLLAYLSFLIVLSVALTFVAIKTLESRRRRCRDPEADAEDAKQAAWLPASWPAEWNAICAG
mmetsp:Transcript_68991/g.194569  ORF Transcript_68991/g.194569 Transcript_68991/m.194569 type:complete len:393 (+) Transcript_68991:176-1354(+)